MDPNNTEAIENLIELGRREMYQKQNYKEAKNLFTLAKTIAPFYKTHYINMLLDTCNEKVLAENEKHQESKIAKSEQTEDNTREPFVGDNARRGREHLLNTREFARQEAIQAVLAAKETHELAAKKAEEIAKKFALYPGKEESPSHHLANSNSKKNKAEEFLKKSRFALENKNFDKAEEYAYRCINNSPVRAQGLLSDIKESKEMTLRSGRTLNTINDHETRCVSHKDLITDDQIEYSKGNLDKNSEDLNKPESLQVQSERLRAESERITVHSKLGQPCKLSDRGWRSGTNIESNKEAYNNCIEKAEQALFVKDYDTADRLVKRAYRMNPRVELESLVEKFQIEKHMNAEVKNFCQNPDTHNKRPSYANYNQMEVKKCEKLAKEAHAQGNLDKDERRFLKASRMGSSKTIEDSLSKVQKEKNMNADDKSKNSDENFDTSAEGTLKASEKKNCAVKSIDLARDTMNIKCYYSVESLLKKANHDYPNETTKQLLENVREAIQASLANTHSENQKKRVAVEKQKEMKTEAYKYLRMTEDKIKQNDLDSAREQIDSYGNDYRYYQTVNRMGYMTAEEEKKRDAEKCLQLAEAAYSSGNHTKAERLLLKSERLYHTTLAKQMLKDIQAAKDEETSSASEDLNTEGGYNLESSNTTYTEYKRTDEDKKAAVTCIEIAKSAISKGNFDKAKNFLLKSERLFPNESAKELLKRLDDLRQNYSSTSYSNGTCNSLGNKDEADKCVQIAEAEFLACRLARAERLLRKAERLFPTTRAKDLLRQIEEAVGKGTKDSDEGKPQKPRQSRQENGRKSNQENERPRRKEPTYEEVDAIRRVKEGKDDYEILGVGKQTSAGDVRKAFRRLTLLLHPDRNKAPGAKEAFMIASEASERLRKKCSSNK